MIKTVNDKTITVKISRGELCRLLILITGMGEGESWKKLHDKLKEQLDSFDRKMEEIK